MESHPVIQPIAIPKYMHFLSLSSTIVKQINPNIQALHLAYY